MQEIVDQPTSVSLDPPVAQSRGGASVFLMNSDLSTGGTERQFSLMAKSLRNRSFDLHLGCMRRRGAFLEGIENIAEFDVEGSFLTLRAQRVRRVLAQHLRERSVAVAHSFDFYANLMLIPVARWARVPVVIGSQRNLGDLLTPAARTALFTTFRLCTRVLCNSRAAARSLLNHGLPESKIVVIPNGLPEDAFAFSDRVPLQNPSHVRIGLIARMNHPVKSQEVFLQAAARLASRFSEAQFVLVGDGKYRRDFERLAETLGIARQVEFLGERRDIPTVLSELDISVVASRSESLSNVILESMAAGKPVIATRVGGNSEIVHEGQTGLLVPPRDIDALVNAFEVLLASSDLRRAMGQEALQIARRDFSLDRIRDRYEQLYASLLEEKQWKPKWHAAGNRDVQTAKPLAVAIVGPSLRYVGGQAVQADLLLRNWKDDPELNANFIPVDTKLPRGLGWADKVPYLRTILRIPFYLASLWRGMSDVDIVHIFSASYWSFLLGPAPASLMARLRGKKSLINYRSGEAPDHLRRSLVARAVLDDADQLVVPSGYLVDVFRDNGLEAKVVPNIVDLSQFVYRERTPLRPLLIATRMFETYYQVGMVVRAFAELAETFPDARLCLVGSGSEEPELRALVASLNLQNVVEFAGAIPRQQIGRYYDRADIFVNASRLDNMPVSVLEAFASGTPVVTTSPGGIPYIVAHERTGLLSEPGDWHALAKNTIRLLTDQEFALRLAQNAHVESRRYNWDAVRTQWLDVYRSLGAGTETERPMQKGYRNI